MAHSIHHHSAISETFFKPLTEELVSCIHQPVCEVVPDALWLEIGVRRCLSTCHSGRDFLQYLFDCRDTHIEVETYFETLKSKRRLALAADLNGRVRQRMRAEIDDPFAQFECLKNYEIFAGDGHFHAASCHDSSPTDKKYPTGHLFSLDLRCHAMTGSSSF